MIEQIFIYNFSFITTNSNLNQQKNKLFKLIIKHQSFEILKPNVLGLVFQQGDLNLITVITDKEKNNLNESVILDEAVNSYHLSL